MNKKIIIILFILLTLFAQNTFSDVNLFPDLYKTKIIGLWNFDVEAFINSEEYQGIIQDSPGMEEIMVEMFASMVFEFTENEMLMSMNSMVDSASESTKITIISTEGNRIVLQDIGNDGTDEYGDKILIILINDNRIQLMPHETENSEPEFTFYLIRAQ